MLRTALRKEQREETQTLSNIQLAEDAFMATTPLTMKGESTKSLSDMNVLATRSFNIKRGSESKLRPFSRHRKAILLSNCDEGSNSE